MINLGVEEMIKQWIMENIPDFNTKIHTEEDMKIKVLLPYLRSLGYVDEELRFENGIDVQIGTKKTKVYSDIEVIINGKVEMVIDQYVYQQPRQQFIAGSKLCQTNRYTAGNVWRCVQWDRLCCNRYIYREKNSRNTNQTTTSESNR